VVVIGGWMTDDGGSIPVERREFADEHGALPGGLPPDLYRRIFAASPVGIALSNERGLWVTANPAMCRLFGRTEAEMLGHSGAEFTHPDDLDMHRRAIEIIASTEGGVAHLDKRVLRPDGEVRWVSLTASHTTGPNGQVWTLSHAQDITDRKASEQAAAESDADLAAVARVIRRVHSGADARDIVVQACRDIAAASYAALAEPQSDPPALRITACSDPSLVGLSVPLSATSASVTAFRTGKPAFFPVPEQDPLASPALLHATRSRSMYLVPIANEHGVSGLLVVGWRTQVPDLADRRAHAVTLLADHAGVALRQATLLGELQRLADTDQLTGVPNRRGWDEQLGHLLAMTRRSGEPLTVAMADLDHFKSFNDSHGHHAGDELLRQFTSAARAALRGGDLFARWGGEEFTIALPQCSAGNAGTVLNRIRTVAGSGQTCSIGYVVFDGNETAEALMDRADRALYAAKHAGRNTIIMA